MHVRPIIPIKPQIYFCCVIDLGYNTFLLYPRPITLVERYLRFYRYDGPYMLDKTNKFLYLIFDHEVLIFIFHD